jgi:hypothetical protein
MISQLAVSAFSGGCKKAVARSLAGASQPDYSVRIISYTAGIEESNEIYI